MSSPTRYLLPFVLLAFLAVPGESATMTPFPVTGYNQDFVWGVGESFPGTSITPNNFLYYQSDPSRNGGAGGLPATSFTSASNTSTTFQLQPFNSNDNVVFLGDSSTYTVSLSHPQEFDSLAILGAAGNGVSSLNYSLNFASGAPTTGNIAVQDWVGATAISTGLIDTSKSYQYSQVGLGESDLTLSPTDSHRILSSISFSIPNGQSGFAFLYAFSGQAPEPSTWVLFGMGSLGLAVAARRRRQGPTCA